MISIKSRREIEKMRNTCSFASSVLEFIEPHVVSGVTTEELDNLCHEYITSHGAYPSPLNYHGFPKSICTSLNQVICHGIPCKKDVLKDGDILNIDTTTKIDGFHGDTNRTFLIGDVDPAVKKLVDVTYECMLEGIRQVRPGGHIGDIGAVIQEIAHGHSYSVVEEYCGHGIGREFHEEPQVVHVGKKGSGPEMKPGMTFTIEPMINLGSRHSRLLKDDWTVVTRDGKWSAQFEHTILVTDFGHEILTIRNYEREKLGLVGKVACLIS